MCIRDRHILDCVGNLIASVGSDGNAASVFKGRTCQCSIIKFGKLRAAGAVEHLAAERPEEGDDGQTPDIAERFADEGEDKVVVHLV